MTFFYDLNKRLADLAKKQDAQQVTESVKAEAPKSKLAESLAVAEAGYSAKAGRAGKDLGKPGKNFAKIAKTAGAKYGSKAAGERVAGAVLNKLRHPKEDVAQEGNAFTGALKNTPKGGKFKVGGKEFTDTSSLEEVGQAPMTPKQKSFAKLAPPTDKITFADKIAGAKKEVDEMLGDVAAEAIKGAIGKKKEPRSKGTAFDADFMKQQMAKKDAESHSRYDVKDTGYSKRYTRKVQDEPTNDTETSDAPRGRGRPKGAPKGPERTTKGAWKHKGERKVKEEEGHVCEMCGQPVVEKAKSKAQQKFMGMVHAAQKGEKPASKEVAKVAKEMPKKAAKDFAATKHKGLPEKVKAKKETKEEKVDETTTSGSVATSTAAPKASKGMQFGKGVYESFDTQLEQIISEGITVETKMSECGEGEMAPSITITADGEEAAKLMMLLKLAGLDAQAPAACPTCGSAPCACGEQVDENSPDWPTNTETLDADPELRTYSGGLDGPKSTKQSTLTGGGLPSMSPSRQVSMEESVKLENRLFNLYKNFKG